MLNIPDHLIALINIKWFWITFIPHQDLEIGNCWKMSSVMKVQVCGNSYLEYLLTVAQEHPTTTHVSSTHLSFTLYKSWKVLLLTGDWSLPIQGKKALRNWVPIVVTERQDWRVGGIWWWANLWQGTFAEEMNNGNVVELWRYIMCLGINNKTWVQLDWCSLNMFNNQVIICFYICS